MRRGTGRAVRSIYILPDGTRWLAGPAELRPSSQLGIGHLDARVMLVCPRHRKHVHSPEMEGSEPVGDVTFLPVRVTGNPATDPATELAAELSSTVVAAPAGQTDTTATMGE